jgi:sugar-phosphatase
VSAAAAEVGAGLRAVIFDMDGVLIDTEPVWRRVEMAVFGSLGLHLTEADCRETMGVRIDEVVARWYERRPWAGAAVSEVVERIVTGVVDHVRADGRPMEGAVEAVRLVRACGLRNAVASSSPTRLIAAVVEALGIGHDVGVICSAADEARGKPAPDVYLRAATLLGVAPSSCLAIEDSVFGVMSARAAGMTCIVVPDPQTRADPRLGAASLRLGSLRELDRDRLAAVSAAYFS